jgi:hypothetical protein
MWGDAMEQNNKLKLFICYSHSHEDNRDDSPYLNEFIKHIILLKDNGFIGDIWYDRKNLPGENFQNGINNNFENADVICLLISANFFYSDSCKDEKKRAFELWRKKRSQSFQSFYPLVHGKTMKIFPKTIYWLYLLMESLF